MLLPSDMTEHAIYLYVDQVNAHEGRSTSWGALASAVGSTDGTMLLRLLKDLQSERRLEIKKWLSATECRIFPDLALTDEEFFFRGDFRLFLTAKGRRRYEELTPEVKAQLQVDKALELEARRYRDSADKVRRASEDQLADIANRFSGEIYNDEAVQVRLDEIEKLVRERVALRRASLGYMPELLSPEHVGALRREINETVDDSFQRLTTWLAQRGRMATATPDRSTRSEHESLRLKELAHSLLRELQLELDITRPVIGKPLVFISCGQYTEGEKQLGKNLVALVEKLSSCEGYFAENQNSLLGLSEHIFGALDRAVGLIAVMHHRGRVESPTGGHIRGSVWVERESRLPHSSLRRRAGNCRYCSTFRKGSTVKECASNYVSSPLSSRRKRRFSLMFERSLENKYSSRRPSTTLGDKKSNNSMSR